MSNSVANAYSVNEHSVSIVLIFPLIKKVCFSTD